MLIKVLIAIAVLAVIFIVAVSMQPAEFKISRSITVAAPPAAVFAQVNDFRRWANWSPWEKMDLAMKKTFSGPSSGEGSVYAWDGNNKIGAGKMTMTKSAPPELIDIRLEFMRPMRATNITEFTFKPAGGSTVVTWSMSGRNNFMAKAFHLFMNVDKMVGGDFEKGLVEMKAAAEDAAKR